MMHNLNYKYTFISKFFAILSLLFIPLLTFGQNRSKIYENYIDRYCDIAVEHMKIYKIPASITLAQALLESGAGNGDLAKISNNHFGIKCHRGWEGRSVIKADDTPNDCFRSYDRVDESYSDHAKFLVNGSRYSNLFNLPITDYRSWARGLQNSGYATDKAYANKLIKLIEDYELYRFDDKKYRSRNSGVGEKRSEGSADQPVNWKHEPYITYGLVYVLAFEGDTYKSIADEFGFKEKDLLKFNEVPEDFPLSVGDIVYFQKKKIRADKPYFEHVVQIGESMHSISQRYGIQVRNLYRMNNKKYEYVPEEGDILKLR